MPSVMKIRQKMKKLTYAILLKQIFYSSLACDLNHRHRKLGHMQNSKKSMLCKYRLDLKIACDLHLGHAELPLL